MISSYYVHCTLGHVDEQGPNFDFIIGAWGDSIPKSKRVAVSLQYRILENGPSFMVIDAAGRSIADSELVGRALLRADVIGKSISKDVFAYCDLVLAQDVRVAELLGDWTIEAH